MAVVAVSMAAGRLTPLHRHDANEALTVLEGTLTLHVEGETVVLASGDSYVVPAGAGHTLEASAGAVSYLVATVARSLGRYEDFVRAVATPGDLGACAPGLDVIAAANRTVVVGAPGELPRWVAASAV